MTRSRLDSGQPELLHERGGLVGVELAELHLDLGRQRVDERHGDGRSARRSRPRSRSPTAMSVSPTLSSTRTGFWVRKRKPRIAFSSSPVSSRSRIGQPSTRPAWSRLEDRLLALVGVPFGLRPVTAARLEPLEAALGHRQVGQDELEVEPLEIAPGVDRALGVRHRRVLEHAHDVEQRVRVAQPGEVLGRQLLGPDPTLGRRRRRRQVHVGHVGLDDLLGLEDRRRGGRGAGRGP